MTMLFNIFNSFSPETTTASYGSFKPFCVKLI